MQLLTRQIQAKTATRMLYFEQNVGWAVCLCRQPRDRSPHGGNSLEMNSDDISKRLSMIRLPTEVRNYDRVLCNLHIPGVEPLSVSYPSY